MADMTREQFDEACLHIMKQLEPILTGADCNVLGHVFCCLLASWMLSIEADEPEDAKATRLLRAAAMRDLVQEIIQIVQEHEKLLENPQ